MFFVLTQLNHFTVCSPICIIWPEYTIETWLLQWSFVLCIYSLYMSLFFYSNFLLGYQLWNCLIKKCHLVYFIFRFCFVTHLHKEITWVLPGPNREAKKSSMIMTNKLQTFINCCMCRKGLQCINRRGTYRGCWNRKTNKFKGTDWYS